MIPKSEIQIPPLKCKYLVISPSISHEIIAKIYDTKVSNIKNRQRQDLKWAFNPEGLGLLEGKEIEQ